MRISGAVAGSLALTAALAGCHAAPRAEACGCRGQLDFVIGTVERDYPGFPDKVTAATRPAFDRRTAQLRAQADTTHDSTACRRVLTAWLALFHDGHLGLRASTGAAPAAVPRLDRVDGQTLVLRIPSFSPASAPAVDSVVRHAAGLLATTPNLIIDVRGNGGGADFVFEPLLPYLYTGPIITVESSILATQDNIAKYTGLLGDPTIPEAQKTELRALVARLRAGMGTLVHQPDDTTRLARVLPRPARVGLLVDRGCKSSCEGFVLAARQSRKVTLFGAEATGGVLDYANVNRVTAPCGGVVLGYPTSRSQRLPGHPVDPDGIAPQVRIPPGTPDAVAWVGDALARMGGSSGRR